MACQKLGVGRSQLIRAGQDEGRVITGRSVLRILQAVPGGLQLALHGRFIPTHALDQIFGMGHGCSPLAAHGEVRQEEQRDAREEENGERPSDFPQHKLPNLCCKNTE